MAGGGRKGLEEAEETRAGLLLKKKKLLPPVSTSQGPGTTPGGAGEFFSLHRRR